MQAILTLAIELWSFGSSGGFSSSHFESVCLIVILSQSGVATFIINYGASHPSWNASKSVGRYKPFSMNATTHKNMAIMS
jgi:hypothetical protein